MSEARDAYIRIAATVVGAALIGVGTWVFSSLGELKGDVKALEIKVLDHARRIDFMVEKLMELHPMQRSSIAAHLWMSPYSFEPLALGESCPFSSRCRDDGDCPGCSCEEGFCE